MRYTDYSLSLTRLTALILIIICHMMQYYNMILAVWFNVGVQIFLCLSGYLYGHRDISDAADFLNKRLKRILIPYYLAFITYGIMQYLFANNVFNSSNFFLGLIANKTLKGGGHLWFIATILMCYAVTIFLSAYRRKYTGNTKEFIAFSLITLIGASLIFRFFLPYFSPAWICCYIIGYCLRINDDREYISHKIILLAFISLAVIGNTIQINIDYTYNIQIPKDWSTAYRHFQNYNHIWLGISLFSIFKLLYGKLSIGIHIKKILDICDKYSYHVYLVHQFVILGAFSMMSITHHLHLNILIIIVTVFLLAYILKDFENRILSIKKPIFNNLLMTSINLNNISIYRTHIMGFAILWLMFFHSSLNLENIPLLSIFKQNGNIGVDIFLFISGIGLHY